MPGRTIHSKVTRQARLASLLLIAGVAITLTVPLGATMDPPAKPEQVSEVAPANRDGAIIAVESFTTDGVLVRASATSPQSHHSIRYVVEGNNVVVNIENGTVVDAMIGGVAVPAERIRMMEGRVVILDERGQEVQSMHVFRKGPDQEIMLRMLTDRMRNGIAGSDVGHWTAPADWRLRSNFEFRASEPSVMIGMYVERTSPALEYHMQLEPGQTLTVIGLRDDLPAHQAEVQLHDIITSVDGQPPLSRRNFYGTLQQKEPGQFVELTILQVGERRACTVEVMAFDREHLQAATLIGSDSRRFRRSAFESLNLSMPEAIYEGIMVVPGENRFFIDGTMPNFDRQLSGELHLMLKNGFPGIDGMVPPEELIEFRVKIEEMQIELDRVLKRNSEAQADEKAAGKGEEPTD